MILVLKTKLLSNIKLIWNQGTYGIGGGYKIPDSANWYVTQHRYYAYLNQRLTISNNYLSLGRMVLKISDPDTITVLFPDCGIQTIEKVL